MPAYSLAYNYTTNEEENPKPVFAIVVSPDEAHYVNAPTGLDDQRIERLLKITKRQPTTELEWARMLMSNVGYTYSGPLVETETLLDAITQAKAALDVVE